jgi:hypothetical protein
LRETTSEALSAAFPDYKRRLAELEVARTAESKKRRTFDQLRALYNQDANLPSTHLLIRGE